MLQLLSATSTFGIALTNEIISQNTLNIFTGTITLAIITGIFIALIKKVTWWIW